MRKLTLKFFPFLVAIVFYSCSQESNMPRETPQPPIEIKVVVVTMFELGDDENDKPGEFQLWKAGQKLHTRYPFPMSHHDIFVNEETGVMGIVTGMGTAKSASAIMALGLDPRFDLTHAYWLVAGIAGFDPAKASIGSAAWATWLVDGDLAHHIDAKETPESWDTGYFPLFSNEPILTGQTIPIERLTEGYSMNGEVYQLNPQLAEWAYQLTKNTPLNDYPAMQKLRAKYIGYPHAQKRPFVLKGDHLAASTFWHGKKLNQWANDWTHYWTGGQGSFVSSGMEDTGSYQSMVYLDKAGKTDKSRFMVLRTGSNYSMQPPGMSAADNLKAESGENGFAGMQSALESAYLVGSTVVEDIVTHWDKYKTALPYEANKEASSNPSIQNPIIPKQSAKKFTAQELVKHLELQGHVEGGYFRQTFKADNNLLIETARGNRVTMTSIYYLLTADSPIGHFHMNQSDIMHYFHVGDPITYYLIKTDGSLETVVLGPDPSKGHKMQMIVKGGIWKASVINTDGDYGYGLIGEAVSPGFEYIDMQLGETAALIEAFPQHKKIINELSR